MGEVDESEAIMTEDLGTMGGTQSSVMEVEEEEEDEVVVVEEVKQGETRKWALSLLPKMSRKRVQVGTVTQCWQGARFRGVRCRGVRQGWGMWGAKGNHAGGALNTEYSALWPLTGPNAKIARQNTTGVHWCL